MICVDEHEIKISFDRRRGIMAVLLDRMHAYAGVGTHADRNLAEGDSPGPADSQPPSQKRVNGVDVSVCCSGADQVRRRCPFVYADLKQSLFRSRVDENALQFRRSDLCRGALQPEGIQHAVQCAFPRKSYDVLSSQGRGNVAAAGGWMRESAPRTGPGATKRHMASPMNPRRSHRTMRDET